MRILYFSLEKELTWWARWSLKLFCILGKATPGLRLDLERGRREDSQVSPVSFSYQQDNLQGCFHLVVLCESILQPLVPGTRGNLKTSWASSKAASSVPTQVSYLLDVLFCFGSLGGPGVVTLFGTETAISLLAVLERRCLRNRKSLVSTLPLPDITLLWEAKGYWRSEVSEEVCEYRKGKLKDAIGHIPLFSSGATLERLHWCCSGDMTA